VVLISLLAQKPLREGSITYWVLYEVFEIWESFFLCLAYSLFTECSVELGLFLLLADLMMINFSIYVPVTNRLTSNGVDQVACRSMRDGL
jgi:hypothetical protein